MASTIASEFIKTLFGPTTEAPIYICSFANDRDAGIPERHVATRVPGDIDKFAAKWDQPDRGLFFCVATVKAGAKRNKENLQEIICLHEDIDLKDVELSRAEIEKKLAHLPMMPSITVFSGGGLHCYWLFNEALPATPENIERVEMALRQLADLIGADLQCCECSRVLRLPGGHNTKNGAWTAVEVLTNNGLRYELDDIEQYLAEASPIILRKERPRAITAGETKGETSTEGDYFLKFAKEHGTPVDIEKRVDGMMYMGGGDAAVHATQIAVSASMLSSGYETGEVVEYLLAATAAAAGDYGKRWNWTRERRTIEKMCETWIKKHPEIAQPEKPKLTLVAAAPAEPIKPPSPVDATRQLGALRDEQQQAAAASGATASAPPSNVTPIKPPLPPKPPLIKKEEPHVKLGIAVLGNMKDIGDDLVNTRKGMWFYHDGLWELQTSHGWLEVLIEAGCRALNYKSKSKLISETRQWITRNPEIWHDEIEWDAHGKIPTRSGLVDPVTREIEPLRSDHYCSWRIECDYDPKATCPWWETMLLDVFSDREQQSALDCIRVIQEIIGASLIDLKPRELSKALILWGGSNCGKSGLLEVFGGLFGKEQISTPLEALENTHGLMQFTRRRPWILHEAFNPGKWHLSSEVKAIITHEPVLINIKNGPLLSTIVHAPIFWASNYSPQFKESTKAITNRLIVINCLREFKEGDTLIGTAAEAARQGLDKPQRLVLRDEMSGVLNWAITGLQRAAKRGVIELTPDMIETSEEIRRDSNLVAGFLPECVEYDPDKMLSVPDFCAAFAVWWTEGKGESRSQPSNESIGKALAAMNDPLIAMHAKELRFNHRRYYGGVALNDAGLGFWRRAVESRLFEGKTASTTPVDRDPNMGMPASWDAKPSIKVMRIRQSAAVASSSDNPKSQNATTDHRATSELSQLSPDDLSPQLATAPVTADVAENPNEPQFK